MKVQFAEISETGNHYEITENSWFPDKAIRRCAPIRACLQLVRENDSTVTLEGRLQTGVRFVCDRCLTAYDLPVDVRMRLILEYVEESLLPLQETGDAAAGPETLDVIMLAEPAVDLGDILRQQIFLSLPLKHLCRQDCRGLCPRCGTDLNVKTCNCLDQDDRSPFAVLKKLKKS
ncbi:hypothetical protein BMS3Bbin14_00569 [bacterium BMS3Bbin14]|nr:hypothetical protein BMS3Abin13_00173 [bacterium BMS3Abin13]GBE52111.1 hypothetical protein BMS3Bbin14_00569 [bacterium BMS3Bbin14]HDO30932.1 DUF177 domain-containing protein [Desulfobacteraceae bacterium]